MNWGGKGAINLADVIGTTTITTTTTRRRKGPTNVFMRPEYLPEGGREVCSR